MRKRKHARPNQRRRARYQPSRRRKVMMNMALVVVVLMAGSYILASLTRKMTASTDLHAATAPASKTSKAASGQFTLF